MNKKDKKSFIVHIDLLESVNLMTDEEAGKMMKAIAAFWNDEEVVLPRELMFAFAPIRQQFNRDWEAYLLVCEKNKLNGNKGGRPRKTQKTQVVSKKPNVTQRNPKNPDNDNDNDNDNVKDKKHTHLSMLVNMGVDENLAKEWLSVRKAKRLQPTQTAFNAIKTQADKAGLSMNDAVKKAVEEGWGGFKAEWLEGGSNNGRNETNRGNSQLTGAAAQKAAVLERIKNM